MTLGKKRVKTTIIMEDLSDQMSEYTPKLQALKCSDIVPGESNTSVDKSSDIYTASYASLYMYSCIML